MDDNKITYFAETDSRNKHIPFGIKRKDRSRHTYVVGKTGMGKSTLLENMAVQDIQSGEGMAFIDPHGKSAELLLEYVPPERLKDVIYFAPFDADYPISFNVMEDVGFDKRHLVASGLMSAFKKIWVDAWSARMEYILNNILLALLEYPGSTLIGVNRMLADKKYRDKVVSNVTDSSVKAFWVDEFAKYGERYMQEAGASIQNKVGQFVSNPIVRNIIGQPTSSFDPRKVMDERKILIINLSKGKVGETDANLIGSMLITKLYLAAMSRAELLDSEVKKLPDFYMYVDEFQSFANESFANILSEARKYKLALTMAHQYIAQMTDEVRDAVLGNVGTMIMFRVGAFDAEVLEKEFAPQFTAQDMVNLGFVQIYLKLMIDGVTSQPFSARTLPPIEPPRESLREEIIEHSRKTFGSPRSEVEAVINESHKSEQDKPISKTEQTSGAKDSRGKKDTEKDRKGVPSKKGGGKDDQVVAHRKAESGGEKRRSTEKTDVDRTTENQKGVRENAERGQSESRPATLAPSQEDVDNKQDHSANDNDGNTSLKDALRSALASQGNGSGTGESPKRVSFDKSGEAMVGNKPHAQESNRVKHSEQKDNRSATPEHMEGLRSVLSDVTERFKKKTGSTKETKTQSKEKSKSDEPEKEKGEGRKSKREVPESELRKILEVNE